MLTCACANEEMPPGHGPDFDPPAVIETFPIDGSAVPGLDDDAYLRFDEPLGDPRSLVSRLVTSPAWTYDVKAGRSSVRIRPRDGWQPNVVYRFQIPPGLRDLIRNVTREPIELLFTTGASLTRTRATGRVFDRATVRAVREAAVLVVGSDSVPYAAVTDTGGYFSVPSLPIGEYWIYGFQDQNRNRRLDRAFEPYDSGRVALPDSQSVADLELWMTAPDSTPPVLASAGAVDSLRLRLEFDELLEPDADLTEAGVRVTSVDAGGDWPVESFVVGQEVVPDTVVADSSVAQPPRLPSRGPETQLEVELRTRPQSMVSVRLGRPLTDGTYSVHAEGFANLRGLRGGGDTTFVYAPPAGPQEAGPPLGGPEPDAGGAEPGPQKEAAQEVPAGEDLGGEVVPEPEGAG
jgi:hypothetical protein